MEVFMYTTEKPIALYNICGEFNIALFRFVGGIDDKAELGYYFDDGLKCKTRLYKIYQDPKGGSFVRWNNKKLYIYDFMPL